MLKNAVKILLIVFVLGSASGAFAGDDGVENLLNLYLKAHNTKNIRLLKDCFYPEAITAYIDIDGEVVYMPLDDFIVGHKRVYAGHEEVEEKFISKDVEVYQDMAFVSADYTYKLGDDVETGKDYIMLVRVNGEWKIMSLMYTLDRTQLTNTLR